MSGGPKARRGRVAPSRLPGLLGLLMLPLAGCDADEVQSSRLPPCVSDAECGASLACVTGFCATAVRPPLVVDVELRPPTRSRFVPTELIEAEIPPSGRWTIVLQEPVEHATVVLDEVGARIEADLVFRPSDARGALDAAYRLTDNQPVRIPLPPETYDVQVTPLDRVLPSFEVQRFVVQPGGATLRQKEFVLPERYRRLTGSVQTRQASSQRVASVVIQATGVDTGLTSTPGESGLDGSYAVLLPNSRDTAFRLQAQLPEDLQPAWDFEQVIRVPSDEDREKAIDVDLPSDVLRGSVRIEVFGLGPSGPEPVRDARVTLTATASSEVESRIYRVVGRTDDEGRVRVGDTLTFPVLRSRYRSVVEPPLSSDFARYEGTLDLGSAGSGVTVEAQITLEPRTIVRGRVTDANGAPMPFARVTFSSLSGEDLRAPDANSDASGFFEVELDPGPHRVTAQPRHEEGRAPLPWAFADVLIPEAEAVELAPLVVGPPLLVGGVVLTADGQPLSEVEITIYPPGSEYRVPIGRVETNDAGGFQLALPGE